MHERKSVGGDHDDGGRRRATPSLRARRPADEPARGGSRRRLRAGTRRVVTAHRPAIGAAALAALCLSTPAHAITVTFGAPTAVPDSAKPDGGLRVSLTADRAGARRAVAELVPARSARRIRLAIRATGVAAVPGDRDTAIAVRDGDAARVAFAWAAERAGLGTIETQARTYDRRGRLLASSRDTLYLLRTGTRVLTSTAGPLDLHVRRIRALDGVSAALRAQRLERLLGAGAATASSTRATGGSAITVGGTVRFTDGAGATHAARHVDVELRERTVNGSQLVQAVATDDAGRYTATLDKPAGAVDLAHAGGYNLFVRASASGPGYSVEGPSGVYRIESAVAKGVKPGSAVTVDLTANNVADNNTAFSVGEAMYEVHEYMEKIGMPVPAIPVDFPTADVTSNYSNGKLHMLRGDRFDTDVAHHEYGHYVSDRLAIMRNPGGPHGGSENLSETGGRNKDAGIRLAWGEGWPTYFGTSLQTSLGLARLAIPTVGDVRYTDTDDASIDDDLEVPDARQSIGEDGETAVQRFLWDLFDRAADRGDEVSLGDRPLLNALVAGKAVTLSQGYAAVVRDVPPRQRIAIGCAAEQQRISPAITAPARGGTLPATQPTFVWTPNGGGPKYRSNSFTVQFWDRAFTTLLHESPRVAGTRFRPTDETWRKVTAGGRKVLQVVVRGSQTSSPTTGPYDSCALQLGSQ